MEPTVVRFVNQSEVERQLEALLQDLAQPKEAPEHQRAMQYLRKLVIMAIYDAKE